MAHRRVNSTRRAVVGALATLAMVGVAGCGGDDDDEASDADAAEVSADDSAGGDDGDDGGDGGESSGSGGESASGDSDGASGDQGGDFPIPAPDGLVLDVLVDSGLVMEGQRQLLYANDDFDRIVAFYDDWTSQNGEWARAEAQGTVVYQSLDGESVQMINVTPDHDPGAQAEGPTTIVLLVAG